MSSRWYFLSLALLISVFHPCRADNGKITGRVTESGGIGIQATIRIEESKRAIATDSTGWYLLLNIPPGIYDVTASAVGFHPSTFKNVHVSADETLTLSLELVAGEVTMPEIIVEAKTSVIERSRTSAKTTFDGDEVQQLPVASITSLISTAPGVYGPFIRGAHQYDSRVYVDGVDVTDRSATWVPERLGFSNAYLLENTMHVAEAGTQAFLSPSTFAVAQATVYAGMAVAEYGAAPGVITYALEEGKGPWHGRLQWRMSQLGGLWHCGPPVYNDAGAYFATRDLLANSTNPAERQRAAYFTWSPGKYPYGGRPSYSIDFGIGGRITDWMGTYIGGAWIDSYGRLPNERTRQANATAKLTFPFSAGLTLNILSMLKDEGRLLGWKNQAYEDWYRFFLEGVPRWDGLSVTGSVKLSHFLSRSSFYELQVSYYHDNKRRGFCDDNNDGVVSPWEDKSYITWDDPLQVQRYFGGVHSSNFPLFFSSPDDQTADYRLEGGPTYKLNHPVFLYEDYTHRNLTVRGTLTSQVTPQHLLSFGGEIRQHWIQKLHRDTQWGGYSGIPFFEETWTRKPMEFSGFVQDRLEYDRFIATLGFRVDAFDYDAADIADYFAPRHDVVNSSGLTIKVPVRGKKIPIKAYVSPRIGISHPIADGALLYFSLARTVSPLPYSCLYYNYSSWLGSETILRIDQEPLVTTTYDIGSEWNMFEGFTVSMGLYYRDLQNYNFTPIQPIVPNINYKLVVRSGAADTRGAEVAMTYRPERTGFLRGVSARLSYTYSTFKFARVLYLDQWQYSAEECSALGIPGQLPFGEMEYWRRTYGRDYSGQSPMLSGFDRTHRLSVSLTVPFPLEFRMGCIGTFSSGFYYPEIDNGIFYAGVYKRAGYREGPWNRQVDLRLEKVFSLPGLGKLSAFVDLINAFNWTNILTYIAYDETTFKAWANRGDPTGGPSVNQPVTPEGSLVYGVPREIYFGVSFTF